jgi:hypothetical protein
MKLHTRTLPVRHEQTKLRQLLQDFRQNSDLTDIEYLQALQEEASITLKYMLRHERHPGEEEKRADEE